MKRVMIISLLCLVFLAVLVSAQELPAWLDFGRAANQLVNIIQEILGPLFSAFLGPSEFLFEKILLFFIIISFIFVILKRVPALENNTTALWIVTLAIALLGTRYFGEAELVKNVILPYSVLGVALSAAIPFLIFFFFIQQFNSSVIRKTLWIFFLIVFFGLWASRYESLGSSAWIYFITGITALIFFFFDGTIRRMLVKQQMEQLGFSRREELERDLRRKIADADRDLTNNIITQPQHSYIVRRLRKQLKAIYKS